MCSDVSCFSFLCVCVFYVNSLNHPHSTTLEGLIVCLTLHQGREREGDTNPRPRLFTLHFPLVAFSSFSPSYSFPLYCFRFRCEFTVVWAENFAEHKSRSDKFRSCAVYRSYSKHRNLNEKYGNTRKANGREKTSLFENVFFFLSIS